jgi:hypothetical protein
MEPLSKENCSAVVEIWHNSCKFIIFAIFKENFVQLLQKNWASVTYLRPAFSSQRKEEKTIRAVL